MLEAIPEQLPGFEITLIQTRGEESTETIMASARAALSQRHTFRPQLGGRTRDGSLVFQVCTHISAFFGKCKLSRVSESNRRDIESVPYE